MDARWREGLCARVYRLVCVSSRELRREARPTARMTTRSIDALIVSPSPMST